MRTTTASALAAAKTWSCSLSESSQLRGTPLSHESWLRAYFAVGGSFRHADSIAQLVTGLKAGKTYRVTKPYREGIVKILRDQLADDAQMTAE